MFLLKGVALFMFFKIADFSYQNSSDRPVIVERENLTSRLLGNVFTVEFYGDESIHSINANESLREEFYLKLRDALLKYLNKKSPTNATSITPDTATTTRTTETSTKVFSETSTVSEEVTSTTALQTAATATTATTTTSTTTTTTPPTTTTATTTTTPEPVRLGPGISKRKKRSPSQLPGNKYPPESIKFIKLLEHLRNDTLFVTLTLDTSNIEELREALQHIQDTDALFNETTLSVRAFYEGFPSELPKTTKTTTEDEPSGPNLKFLWIIFMIIIVIIIIIITIVCIYYRCRKRRRNQDIGIITPVNHQNLGFNHPNSIMNDNGWIIPMREVHLPK